MTTPLTYGSFFITGGTLSTSANSYVVRQADTDVYNALLADEFCYVLNSRQMGKSSLMVRTAARLKAAGIAVVVLDLQSIGQNLSPEQWYDGLQLSLGKQLGLEDEIERFWLDNPKYGPLQRFFEVIRHHALPTCTKGIVIFVDEIDLVRTLPFSADEFFMGIRECYVGRATQSDLKRLTFCLVGTATPADLISDTRTSPFNIGKRIAVRDFTWEEAAPLAEGFVSHKGTGTQREDSSRKDAKAHRDAESSRLLARALYWTNGHPFLTQKLCRVVAESRGTSPADVDRTCAEIFLDHAGRESDDNLVFVRNRLLRSEADLAALLDLYKRMSAGKRVPDDETNPLTSILKLSGVARVEHGLLMVSNRIYEHVFDRKWIARHMPDAEFRRQKAAYWNGVMRTSSVFVIVLIVIAALALRAQHFASYSANVITNAFGAFEELKKYNRTARGELYAADMIMAQQEVTDGSAWRALKLLEKHRPPPVSAEVRQDHGEATAMDADPMLLAQHEYSRPGSGLHTGSLTPPPDMRGFEWWYLWRLCHGHRPYTQVEHSNGVIAVAFSPDGRRLVTGTRDGTITWFDASTARTIGSISGKTRGIEAITFSADGKALASYGKDSFVRLLDTATHHEMRAFTGNSTTKSSSAFSPDGRTLAIANENGILLCDTTAGTQRTGPRVSGISCIAFSPSLDHTIFAAGCLDGRLAVCDLTTTRVDYRPGLKGGGAVGTVAFSPSGLTLVAAYQDGRLQIWDTNLNNVFPLPAHDQAVRAMAFSPDGNLLATGSADKTIKLWNMKLKLQVGVLKGHSGAINSIAFSPDGNTLVSGSTDKTVRFWRAATLAETDARLY